jgi:hypothetical protein
MEITATNSLTPQVEVNFLKESVIMKYSVAW